MPRSSGRFGDSYGSSRASRGRRRRLLLSQTAAGDEEPVDFADEDADVGHVLADTDIADRAPSQSELLPMRVALTPGLSDLAQITRLLGVSTPVTWVFAGDSVTHGARYTEGMRSFVEHFAERVRWEMQRLGDVVINVGAAGERLALLLAKLEDRILRFRPHVVSVMLGLNECTLGPQGRESFRDDLRQLIKRLRDEGVLVLLHTPNRIQFGRSRQHADVRSYVKIIRETARECDVPCIDHWAHWKHAGEERVGKWLSPDGIHPNAGGHRELVRLLFSQLAILDERSPTCRVARREE